MILGRTDLDGQLQRDVAVGITCGNQLQNLVLTPCQSLALHRRSEGREDTSGSARWGVGAAVGARPQKAGFRLMQSSLGLRAGSNAWIPDSSANRMQETFVVHHQPGDS